MCTWKNSTQKISKNKLLGLQIFHDVTAIHYFSWVFFFRGIILKVCIELKFYFFTRSARTQVAAVTEAKLEFNLGDSRADTIDKAIKAIDNIMYVGWVSSYNRHFKLVRIKVAPNSRNDSHQVLMFFTDGLEPSGPVQREAKYLRDHKQFEVYAIGKVKVYVHTIFTLGAQARFNGGTNLLINRV